MPATDRSSQSDGKPSGLPPKNPPGGAAAGGALRTGSGEARVQSTVPLKIINPPNHDSLSRISGQLAKIHPSRDVCWLRKPPPPPVSKVKLLYVTESVDSRHRARGSRAVREVVMGRMTVGRCGDVAARVAATDGMGIAMIGLRRDRDASRKTNRSGTQRAYRPHAPHGLRSRAAGAAHALRYNAAIRPRKCSVPATILSSTASSAQKRSRTS